jgi:hypothetical protein
MHILIQLAKAFARTLQVVILTGVLLAIVLVVIAGIIFYHHPAAFAILGAGVLLVLMISLCKAASQGNVYCPQCGSEEHTLVLNYVKGETSHSGITRTCKTCKKTW